MSLPPHERYKQKLFPGSSHSWALVQCEPLDRAVQVLDVGSGSGVMGVKLKEMGFSCVSAVEEDAQARAHTASIYADVAPVLDDFSGRTFGLVLLLDVIEHMAHPEQFLSDLRPLLSPGATILLSVPNVAHWSVRLPLLFGSFRYRERGILDKTHLRFFTRRSLRRLLRGMEGLSIVEESVSVPPVQFVLPEAIWNNRVFRGLSRAHYRAAQMIPGFFGYQLLTVMRNRSQGRDRGRLTRGVM